MDVHSFGVDLDLTFKALADPNRRRLLYELSEREGQTLFELHGRMLHWHSVALTRQALSKHLSVLEGAGLIRIEWRWRSKHHFLERKPLKQLARVWLGPLVESVDEGRRNCVENCSDECAG